MDVADTAHGGRPMQYEDRHRALSHSRYDLIVIGGGSAGLSAAGLAAGLGVRVALLDRERLGGGGLYTGCVPSQGLLHLAGVAARIPGGGGPPPPAPPGPPGPRGACPPNPPP